MSRDIKEIERWKELSNTYLLLLKDKDLSRNDFMELTGNDINTVNNVLHYLTLREPIYEYRLGCNTYYGLLNGNTDIKQEICNDKYTW